MKMTEEEIKKMSKDEIYESLRNNFDGIYDLIKITGMSRSDFDKTVLKTISKTKNNYDGDLDYSEYLKKELERKVFKYIKKQFLDITCAFTIIDNYIKQKYFAVSTTKVALQYFSDLNKFLHNFNYTPSLELLIELMEKNTIFNKMLEIIFSIFKDRIVNGNTEKIFNNELLCASINAYCLKNDIEIEEKNVEDADEIEEYDEDYGILELDEIDCQKEYLREIRKYNLLTVEEERILSSKVAAQDEDARKQFIEKNLRLVVSIAREFMHMGLSLDDLIQEGNIGLMIAVSKYDASQGYKFSTYATYWIRQSIDRALANTGRNIRIPAHKYFKLGTYRKAIRNLELKNGRYPTIEEIAEEMNISVDDVIGLQQIQYDTTSLNAEVSNDESDDKKTELGAFIPSNEPGPEEVLITESMQLEIRQLLEICNLTDRERTVLKLRYGFDDGKTKTLEQVAQIYHVRRERIRQIEAKALMKIRRSKHIKAFAQYTDYPVRTLSNIDRFRMNYRNTNDAGKKTFISSDNSIKKEAINIVNDIQFIYQNFSNYILKDFIELIPHLSESNSPYNMVIATINESLNNLYDGIAKESDEKLLKEEIKKSNYDGKEMGKDSFVLSAFMQISESITIKEVIIFSLKYGFINDSNYTNELIAKLLKVDINDVIETLKHVLLVYNDSLIHLLKSNTLQF